MKKSEFRSFPFRSFPKKNTLGTGGNLEYFRPGSPVPALMGTGGNGRE
jgi:hypothetical protein